MRMAWSKAVKDFRLRKVYEKKTYHFRRQLMADVLDSAVDTTLDFYKTKRVRSNNPAITLHPFSYEPLVPPCVTPVMYAVCHHMPAI